MNSFNNNPYEQFGFKPTQINNAQQTPQQQLQESFGFKPSQPESKFEEERALIDEDLERDIERHTARLTSRGLEQAVGLPGNIRDFVYAIKDIYQKQPQLIKGIKLPKEPPSFQEIEKAIPITKTVSNLLGYLPTSSELKKKSEELTKGYTSAQGEFERAGDEVFEKIVSSAFPGQGPRNVWRNIAASLIGQLGKEAVKYVGGSDKSQAFTDIGLNIAIPLMTGNAPQYNRNLWKSLESNTPNIALNVNQGRQRAQNLVSKLKSEGLGSSGEEKVIKSLEKFLNNTSNGQMTAKQFTGFNRSINEIRGDPDLLTGSKKLLNEVSDIVKDSGKGFQQSAPEFYKDWKQANEAHSAIQHSNYIARAVEKVAEKSPLKSEAARALFGAATHATLGTISTIPPIFAIYKGTQILDRIGRSPVLMRYYTNILTNSLRGNIAEVASNLNKLDESLLKEEQSTKPPFKNSPPKKSS